MSLAQFDHIKSPFDQLDDETKKALVEFYMEEDKVDLVLMYLHEQSVLNLSNVVKAMTEV